MDFSEQTNEKRNLQPQDPQQPADAVRQTEGVDYNTENQALRQELEALRAQSKQTADALAAAVEYNRRQQQSQPRTNAAAAQRQAQAEQPRNAAAPQAPGYAPPPGTGTRPAGPGAQPPAPGYPCGGPGYPPPGPGCPPANPGYQPQGPGYPTQGPGYPSAGPGNQPPGPGYRPQGPGYPTQGPGYPSAGPGNQPPGPGYQPQGPGYPTQGLGYPPAGPSNQPPGPGYRPQGPGYPTQGPGYPPAGPGNQPPGPGYQPQEPGPQPAGPGNQPPSPSYRPQEPGPQPADPGYQHPGPGYPVAGPPVPQGHAAPQAPPAASGKQPNSMEMKIGIRVVSIIGVLLILMGVVLGLNYTFTYLLQSNLIKSIAAYSIGLLLLGGGELSNRRNKNIVSTGLCAGGIAVLFATTAVSYFNLDVLSALAAVLACVIIAALALLFSIRYDSQLIAIFAVVGGHLPMTALEGTPVMLYSGMVYFLLLNLFVLLLAVKKRWQVLKYFSLILSAQSTSVLIGLEGMRFTVASVAYIAANFLLYMGIILVNPLLNKSLLRASDTVLLALNTLAGCGFIYWVLGRSGQDAFNGLMALGFCVFYFAMAKVLGRLLREDAGTRGLFYATSAAFLALGIPLQLESGLITMGWVIEGVALCAFGIAARRKWYRRCGVVLFSLGAAHFVFIDLMFLWMEGDPLFPWRFGIMAAGASILLATLKITYRDQAFWQGKGTAWVRVFQYAVLLFDWFYLLYMSWYLYRYVVRPNSTLWLQLACFLVTWGWAALMRHLPVLRDKAVRVTGLLLCGLGLFCLFACNFMWYNMFGTPYFGVLHFVALAVFNLLGMAVAWDLLRTITKWNPGFREWWPLLTAVTSLILAVQLIQIHPNVRFGSMLVSFVVLAFAVGLIVLGFARRFSYARRFGLALTLLAVAKLFLFDLVFLESWQRILSYFVFGAALIAISFVYQQFALRLGGPAPGDPPPPKE